MLKTESTDVLASLNPEERKEYDAKLREKLLGMRDALDKVLRPLGYSGSSYDVAETGVDVIFAFNSDSTSEIQFFFEKQADLSKPLMLVGFTVVVNKKDRYESIHRSVSEKELIDLIKQNLPAVPASGVRAEPAPSLKVAPPIAATIPDDAIPALPIVKGDTLPDASRAPSPEKTPKKPDAVEVFHKELQELKTMIETYMNKKVEGDIRVNHYTNKYECVLHCLKGGETVQFGLLAQDDDGTLEATPFVGSIMVRSSILGLSKPYDSTENKAKLHSWVHERYNKVQTSEDRKEVVPVWEYSNAVEAFARAHPELKMIWTNYPEGSREMEVSKDDKLIMKFWLKPDESAPVDTIRIVSKSKALDAFRGKISKEKGETHQDVIVKMTRMLEACAKQRDAVDTPAKPKSSPALKPDDKENPEASPISEVQIVARLGRLVSEKGEVNGRITLATELFVASRNVAHGRETLQNSAVAFLTEASRMKVDIKGSISKNDRPSTAAEELAIYYQFGIPGFPINIHKAIEWYTEAKRLAEEEKLPSEDIEKLRVSIFGLEHNLDESESKLSDAEQQKLQESVQAKAQQISIAMGKENNGITLRNSSYGAEGFSKNWKMQRGLSRLENAYQLLSGDQKAALKTVQMELDNYYITEGQITTKGERVITLRYSQSAVEMRETIVDALEKFAKEPSKPAEKEEDKESNAKADVADEKADNEQLQRNAKAYIEQFKGKFESSTEEETRAKALGVEKVFQQWSHEYYELSYCEHNVRDFGHGYSDKLRKQLGIFEQARDAYSKAIAEKKAGPAMRFTPQDKYKTQIEQYDLRYVTPGKVIELGYGGSRYYRHEERLYYSGGQTHDVKGNLRSHQSFCDVENENNLFVLTTNKEFLRAEKEDANGSLTVYRTSRGKFFNEFGAEYKKDPNGLYKLDGKNAWDNEEYIGKVPNGLWYRFIVNEEGMGWGERITDKMTWELEYQITLSAGAHTRVLSPGKSGDRNAIAPNERDMIVGEFLRGRHTWAYDAGEEKKLQEDSQKLVSLYPIIVQVKELLYEKRNRSLATLWDDAKKLEEIRPLLPDLKQAVDLLAGEGGKKGDGTIGNPTMQKYVSIFEDYKEAKKMLDTLRKNTTLASYDTFERTYCEACFKAGMREEGLQKAHEKVKANPDVGWARKLLVEHLGTDPSATPQERTEALELARTLYAENPKDHQKILATVLEKMGKHEEAVQILLDGKEGPQKQADEKKLSGLPEQVRFFLAKYDVTEKFQEGVIKGDVKIDDDSFEKFPEGITKIEGDLEIRSTNFTSLSHDLKEVGGSCGISHSAALQNLADAGLEKVGAILSFNNCPDLRELPKNLHYARHLQAGLCIHLQMLPPNMHVEVGAYLGACTRIERIPPGFTAGYLEIPDAVKKRTKE
ncbi:MAG: hypothetical protein WCG83_05755 [Candidatus Peregrinibacteria bacterium]